MTADPSPFEAASDEDRRAAVDRMLERLHSFAGELDDLERAALASLLAPGIALAFDEPEVEGFGTGL